jgi:8-oxo-dGTP pyrophosphatase MutT (NUDIX family)
MQITWKKLGILSYWLSWPGLYLYLRFSRRTRVVIVYKDKVLLVKGWLGSGKWILPGGGLHKKEQPAAGAAREVREETGIDISAEDLEYFGDAVYKNHGFRFRYYRFFVELSKTAALKPQKGEITEIAWVKMDTLSVKNTDVEALRCIDAWRDLRKYGKI